MGGKHPKSIDFWLVVFICTLEGAKPLQSDLSNRKWRCLALGWLRDVDIVDTVFTQLNISPSFISFMDLVRTFFHPVRDVPFTAQPLPLVGHRSKHGVRPSRTVRLDSLNHP